MALTHVPFEARRFLGTFGSTFSSYISRVRSYHSAALVPDKGVYFTNYPDTPVRHHSLILTLASTPSLEHRDQACLLSASILIRMPFDPTARLTQTLTSPQLHI